MKNDTIYSNVNIKIQLTGVITRIFTT